MIHSYHVTAKPGFSLVTAMPMVSAELPLGSGGRTWDPERTCPTPSSHILPLCVLAGPHGLATYGQMAGREPVFLTQVLSL